MPQPFFPSSQGKLSLPAEAINVKMLTSGPQTTDCEGERPPLSEFAALGNRSQRLLRQTTADIQDTRSPSRPQGSSLNLFPSFPALGVRQSAPVQWTAKSVG
jgi:hypothetical protein